MKEKEFTFQCIVSILAETEEQARLQLASELENEGSGLFDCILELDLK